MCIEAFDPCVGGLGHNMIVLMELPPGDGYAGNNPRASSLFVLAVPLQGQVSVWQAKPSQAKLLCNATVAQGLLTLLAQPVGVGQDPCVVQHDSLWGAASG